MIFLPSLIYFHLKKRVKCVCMANYFSRASDVSIKVGSEITSKKTIVNSEIFARV